MRVLYGCRRVHVLLRRDGWAVNPRRSYCLCKEVGLQLCQASQTLERVCRQIGYLVTIRDGNGSEFISRDLYLLANHKDVVLDCSRPGMPTDKSYNEFRLLSAIGNKALILFMNGSSAPPPA